MRMQLNMREAFEILRSYPMIGDFLAYQFVTDLNYSEICDFSEMEFVIPGPGARDGIHKCFSDLGGLSEPDIIRLVTDRQEYEFERLGLVFRSLWGTATPADRLPEPLLRSVQVRPGDAPRRHRRQRQEADQAGLHVRCRRGD